MQKLYSAWFDGRDITSELAKADLPAYFHSVKSYSAAHLGKLNLNFEHPLIKKGYFESCSPGTGEDTWCPQWEVHQWFTFAHPFPAHGTANISWSYAPRPGYYYSSLNDYRLWELSLGSQEIESILPKKNDNQHYLVIWLTARLDSIPSPEPAKRVTLSVDWQNSGTEYFVSVMAGGRQAFGKNAVSLAIENTPLPGEATFCVIRRLEEPPKGDSEYF